MSPCGLVRWLDSVRNDLRVVVERLDPLAERYIDEGLRSEELPGIEFRPGPTGRRAALLGGPDVWEIVRDVRAPRRRSVKFVLNEMWSNEIARQLRGRGHDVIAATAQPRRYRSIFDHEFFRRAQEDGRAIVTDNVPDFMTIVAERARRAEPYFGVVFAVRPMFDRAHPAVIGEMTRALDTLLREHESEGRAGCVLCLQR